MRELEELANKLKAYRAELVIWTGEVIDDNASLIQDKVQDQLYAGENADGSKITPPYTNLTRAIKRRKGQSTDRVTLLDKGDLYKGIKLKKVSNLRYDIESTDEKTAKLEAKYGDKWEDLSEESKQEVVTEIILPDLEDRTQKYFVIR